MITKFNITMTGLSDLGLSGYETPSSTNISYFFVTNKSDDSNGSSTIPAAGDVGTIYQTFGIAISIISVIGIVFNLLNIYVLVSLVRRRRGVSPTYHLLIAMGVADLMVLTVVSFFFLNVYTRTPPLLYGDLTDNHSDFYHLLHNFWMFPANIFSIASNWLVVATTIFRFLAVSFPMKVCQWCTLLRMRISIVLIFACSVLLNTPDWFTIKPFIREDGRLRIDETQLYNRLQWFYYLYHIIEIYIPFLIDFILVIFLIINLNSATASMSKSMPDENAAAREKEHRKIGIMLTAIVLWFLLCNLPVIIYQIMRESSAETKLKTEKQEFFVKLVIIKDFGPLLNHAGNIVFYCLCNSTYRKMFVNTLLCRKKKQGGQSQNTMMTQIVTRNERMERLRESRESQHRSDRSELLDNSPQQSEKSAFTTAENRATGEDNPVPASPESTSLILQRQETPPPEYDRLGGPPEYHHLGELRVIKADNDNSH